MKKCSKCLKLKPKNCFSHQKLGRDGLRADCKSCNCVRSKEYARKNPERVLNNRKSWYSKKGASYMRERRILKPEMNSWAEYRLGARRRGLVFELQRDMFNDLIFDNCFYCGTKPTPINGIDRVDNRIGYTKNNVVTACTTCNIGKSTSTKENYMEWLERVADHVYKMRSVI